MEEKEADRPADAADTAIMNLSYTLDASNAIIAVSGDWDRVALDNGGEQIISRRIIGRRLDDFITGDVTLMFVRTMLMSARTLKYIIRRPYRCDSPQLKRSMEMTVVPRAQGVLEVCHRQLRSEPYRYPLEGIVVQDSDGLRKQKIELGVVIEFGGESGMAELQNLEASVRQEIERLLRDIRFGELIHPEGKSRLKELIVRTVDRQLKTARVRQVYLTEFRVNL